MSISSFCTSDNNDFQYDVETSLGSLSAMHNSLYHRVASWVYVFFHSKLLSRNSNIREAFLHHRMDISYNHTHLSNWNLVHFFFSLKYETAIRIITMTDNARNKNEPQFIIAKIPCPTACIIVNHKNIVLPSASMWFVHLQYMNMLNKIAENAFKQMHKAVKSSAIYISW